MDDITITLEEGQRQMMLLALAKLGIERPGWMWALEQIALKMDNKREGSEGLEAELFRKFYELHKDDPPYTPLGEGKPR